MLDKNRFMKFLMVFMWLYYAAILLFSGVMMAIGMKHSYNGVAGFQVFDGGLFYLLIIDFWTRFAELRSESNRLRPRSIARDLTRLKVGRRSRRSSGSTRCAR